MSGLLVLNCNLYYSVFSVILLQKFVIFSYIGVCLYCPGYKVIKKIGEGTFSEVLKTQSLKDGKFYACKTMKQTINRYVIFQIIVH